MINCSIINEVHMSNAYRVNVDADAPLEIPDSSYSFFA